MLLADAECQCPTQFLLANGVKCHLSMPGASWLQDTSNNQQLLLMQFTCHRPRPKSSPVIQCSFECHLRGWGSTYAAHVAMPHSNGRFAKKLCIHIVSSVCIVCVYISTRGDFVDRCRSLHSQTDIRLTVKYSSGLFRWNFFLPCVACEIG